MIQRSAEPAVSDTARSVAASGQDGPADAGPPAPPPPGAVGHGNDLPLQRLPASPGNGPDAGTVTPLRWTSTPPAHAPAPAGPDSHLPETGATSAGLVTPVPADLPGPPPTSGPATAPIGSSNVGSTAAEARGPAADAEVSRPVAGPPVQRSVVPPPVGSGSDVGGAAGSGLPVQRSVVPPPVGSGSDAGGAAGSGLPVQRSGAAAGWFGMRAGRLGRVCRCSGRLHLQRGPAPPRMPCPPATLLTRRRCRSPRHRAGALLGRRAPRRPAPSGRCFNPVSRPLSPNDPWPRRAAEAIRRALPRRRGRARCSGRPPPPTFPWRGRRPRRRPANRSRRTLGPRRHLLRPRDRCRPARHKRRRSVGAARPPASDRRCRPGLTGCPLPRRRPAPPRRCSGSNERLCPARPARPPPRASPMVPGSFPRRPIGPASRPARIRSLRPCPRQPARAGRQQRRTRNRSGACHRRVRPLPMWSSVKWGRPIRLRESSARWDRRLQPAPPTWSGVRWGRRLQPAPPASSNARPACRCEPRPLPAPRSPKRRRLPPRWRDWSARPHRRRPAAPRRNPIRRLPRRPPRPRRCP